MLKDKELLSILWKVATPIALQNLLISLLSMIDTIMIGSLGDLSIAAVGLGNQIFFILSLMVFGITSGTAIYVAQFYGKKDFENIKKPVAYSLVLSVIISIVFSIFAIIMPEFSIKIFTNDIDIINLGAQYLKIVGWSYLLFSISLTFAVALRSTHQVNAPLIITGVSLVVNAVFNYLLIFGKLGFPVWGVRGAAVATLFARIVEVICFLYLVYFKNNLIAPRLKDFIIEKTFFMKYIITIVPVIMNETLWGLGISMYSAVFGRISKEIVAANQIARNVEQILTVLFIGIGSAAAVIIGKKIGENDRNGTLKYARSFARLSIFLGFIVGVLLIIFAPYILKIYTVSDEAKLYSLQFLIVIGVIMCIKMFNFVNIVGILRAGGDTMFCLLLDAGAVWLIGVPLVYLAGLRWHMSILVVMICLNFEEVVKGIIGYYRLRSKKWINDLVN